MINCHTHLFNEYHVPEDLLKLYVKWLPNFSLPMLGNLLDSAFGSKVLKLTGFLGTDGMKRYINFIKFGYGMTVREQFSILKNAYPPGTKFVVLLQDFQFISNYKAKVNYDSFIQEILNLRKLYPNELLPFHFVEPRYYDYSTDPQQIYDDLKTRFDRDKFCGLKMYPAEGYFPWDFRLNAFYQFAQDHQLPIMTHCSTGGSRYVKQTSEIDRNPLDLYGQHQRVNLPGLAWLDVRKDYTGRARYFSDPENYREVLKKYPDLKICLAHSGSNSEINIEINNRERGTNVPNWYRSCLALLDQNKNVYMDLSYSLYDKKFIDVLIKPDFIQNGNAHRQEHLLFGTDFYMTYTEIGAGEKDLSDVERQLARRTEAELGAVFFQKISSENPDKWLY